MSHLPTKASSLQACLATWFAIDSRLTKNLAMTRHIIFIKGLDIANHIYSSTVFSEPLKGLHQDPIQLYKEARADITTVTKCLGGYTVTSRRINPDSLDTTTQLSGLECVALYLAYKQLRNKWFYF